MRGIRNKKKVMLYILLLGIILFCAGIFTCSVIEPILDQPQKATSTPANSNVHDETVVSESRQEMENRQIADVSVPARTHENQTVDPVAAIQPDAADVVVHVKAAMERKAFDKALALLRATWMQTTDPDKQMELGQMLFECMIRTHDYAGALNLGRELLTLNPTPQEQLRMNQQLAALLHRMGRTDEAEQLLQKAISEASNTASKERLQAQLRGVWRHTDGRTDQVISNLTLRIQEDSRDEESLRALGDIHLKSRRDYEAALPIYERLLELHPDDPQTQSALLRIYRETSDYDEIRQVYESRLEQVGGEDSAIRLSIAQNELQAGRGDAAVEYAEQYLTGPEATPFELQMLSTVYDKAGRKDRAIATLDEAIHRETNMQQRVSMQFQKTDMLIWDKQYAESESLLRAIIADNPGNKQIISRARSEIFRIYRIQGKLSELSL